PARDRGAAKGAARARPPDRGAAGEPAAGPATSEPPPVAEPAPPREAPPAEGLPQVHPDAVEEVDRRFAPTPLQAPPTQRQLAPPPTLPARETPLAPAAPIEPIVPSRIEREVAAPASLSPREAPLVPAAPIEPIVPPP